MYILVRVWLHKLASSPQVGWTSTSIGVEWLEQMLYCRSSWEWAIKLHIHKMRKDLVANKSLNWHSLIATLQQRWVKTEKFLSKLLVIVLILLLKNWFSLARKISIFTFSKTALNNKNQSDPIMVHWLHKTWLWLSRRKYLIILYAIMLTYDFDARQTLCIWHRVANRLRSNES